MNISLQRSLCDMQGKLFEESADMKYESAAFIEAFMTSDVSADLDSTFNHMQWAGKEYILERMQDELKDKLLHGKDLYDKETLYWIGYVYRYWHFYTGETSKEIYKQAPAERMRSVFLPYHALSVELAIERLKETYQSEKKS